MTQPTPPLDLDALRALVDAASEGPWETGDDGLVWAPRIGDPVSGSTEIPDAEFIAASREAVPALIAEVERLRAKADVVADHTRAEVDRLQAEVDRLTRLLGPAPAKSRELIDVLDEINALLGEADAAIKRDGAR